MRMFGRRIESETPELHAEGVRMRFIGRRSAPVSGGIVEKMEWAEVGDRARTTGSRCTSRSTTAGGRRSSTRREAFTGGDEDEFRASCTRRRCTIRT